MWKKWVCMRIILVFSFVIFVLAGCSSSRKKSDTALLDNTDSEKSMNIPKWVYSAQESCSKSLICASASGQDQAASDLNAKKSLGSIFETKIKSRFEVEQHDYSSSEVNEMMERVSDYVSESVDTVLKGAYIKDRHVKDNLYFSLAVLNKMKASKVLSTEIEQLDDQIDYLFSQGKKSSIFKLHMLFDQREILNQKFIILTGIEKKSNYSFSKINSLKYKGRKLSRIKLKAVNSVPRTTIKWMESMFTDMGFKVIKESNSDYLVKVKYFTKELYLKVRGFKKFSFSIVAEAKNNAGEKIGVSTSEIVSTGRNEQDAFLKVKEKLQDSFKENVDKLNLQ